MMNLLFYIYLFLITIFVVYLYKIKNTKDDIELNCILDEFRGKKDLSVEFVEVLKIIHSKNPWYEKSLSAIGAIAFVSMFAATAIQTIDASKKKQKAEELGKKIEEKRKEINNLDNYIIYAGNVVIDNYNVSGTITKSGLDVLNKYTELLNKKNRDNENFDYNLFFAYMMTKQYSLAVHLIEKSVVGKSKVKDSERLTLAEYYVIVSDYHSARKNLSLIRKNLSILSPDQKLRFYAVAEVVNEINVKQMERVIAGALAVDRDEARKRVYSEVKKLHDARKKYLGLQ